jgi:hypothetical protein
MKKLILTLTASLACVAAFAQGKISFQTDSLHLAYYDASVAGYAGVPVTAGTTPGGVVMMADLYMGTSSTALTLQTSTTFSSVSQGKWNTANYAMPGVAAGSTVYVEVQVRDTGYTPASSLDLSGNRPGAALYYGLSSEFTFVLGGNPITYPQMYSATAGSTWQNGTFNMDSSAYGTGARGAIAVSAAPEPASFALAGLGIAAMAIMRRRK